MQTAGQVDKRDLSKLKRTELLEIMLAQSEEIDRLRTELAEKDRQLHDRRITIAESGSLAEASLKLTRVFEEAQKAADLYLDNVKASAQASQASAPAASAPAPGAASAHAAATTPLHVSPAANGRPASSAPESRVR